MLDIIGLMAAVFTTVAFLPQVIKVIQTKNTEAISLPMYAMFSFGVLLWLIYGIMLDATPIILANAFTLCSSVLILILKLKYQKKV